MNREEIEMVEKLAEKFPETPNETILRAFEAWKSEGYEIGSLVEIFYKALETDEKIESESKFVEQMSFDFGSVF